MSSLEQCKVLYIEDDKSTRDALSYFMRKKVGKLFSVGTYNEAIESFMNNRPDIVIADLILPDGNGLDIIREIREKDHECRIFITTSVDKASTIIDAVELDIEGYVLKPIDGVALLEKLEKGAQKFLSLNLHANESSIATETRAGEEMVKKLFLDLLKKKSGRGSKDTNVTWLGGRLEIIVYDALTPMERTMAANTKNHTAIEQGRTLFYTTIKPELEATVLSALSSEFVLMRIHVDVMRKVDILEFELLL